MTVVIKDFGGRYRRFTDQSAANVDLTLSTPAEVPLRILFVTVKYSAAPTQSGITVILNSGAGSVHDTLLATGLANALDTVYFPDGDEKLSEDDVIDVLAPAGGAGITSAVAIYMEVL